MVIEICMLIVVVVIVQHLNQNGTAPMEVNNVQPQSGPDESCPNDSVDQCHAICETDT